MALDLTGKADLTGRQRIVLGVLDHGSRAALILSELADKRSCNGFADDYNSVVTGSGEDHYTAGQLASECSAWASSMHDDGC